MDPLDNQNQFNPNVVPPTPTVTTGVNTIPTPQNIAQSQPNITPVNPQPTQPEPTQFQAPVQSINPGFAQQPIQQPGGYQLQQPPLSPVSGQPPKNKLPLIIGLGVGGLVIVPLLIVSIIVVLKITGGNANKSASSFVNSSNNDNTKSFTTQNNNSKAKIPLTKSITTSNGQARLGFPLSYGHGSWEAYTIDKQGMNGIRSKDGKRTYVSVQNSIPSSSKNDYLDTISALSIFSRSKEFQNVQRTAPVGIKLLSTGDLVEFETISLRTDLGADAKAAYRVCNGTMLLLIYQARPGSLSETEWQSLLAETSIILM